MIKMLDLFSALKISLNKDNYKIHIASYSENSPLEAYYDNSFKEWQEWQSKRNFKCEMVISLIQYSHDVWMFAGVYKILGNEWIEDHYEYDTIILPNQEEFIGRIFIKHKRTGRASYLWGTEKIEDQFVLHEIRPKALTIQDYPGHNNVLISHRELKIIINQQVETWYGALSNIKGIYLITDTHNGKHYVGSAKGEEGIWQRWCNYANDGHGGNKELKLILKEKGDDYMNNFQYAILEIADFQIHDDNIIERESYWKNILKSREFGYNEN